MNVGIFPRGTGVTPRLRLPRTHENAPFRKDGVEQGYKGSGSGAASAKDSEALPERMACPAIGLAFSTRTDRQAWGLDQLHVDGSSDGFGGGDWRRRGSKGKSVGALVEAVGDLLSDAGPRYSLPDFDALQR